MRFGYKLLAPIAAALMCATPATMAADTDADFDRVARESLGQDTGSGWFDYYVATVNQQIAYLDATEPYGAAGPNGPLQGFDGYLNGFVQMDTGSARFNDYVEDLAREMADKGY